MYLVPFESAIQLIALNDCLFIMIKLSFRPLYILLFLLIGISANAQYLPNPSLEGIPTPHVPPPGWTICNTATSTPDTQPGNFGVNFPPSHLSTYIGMTARDDFTWEDMQTTLINPLVVDSCYIFKIDLAYQPIVNGLFMSPLTLRIYGGTAFCDQSNLLWQSPPISNEDDWVTHEFLIHPQTDDITNIVLEAYYVSTTPYWGYLLADNIVITQEPEIDLGNDTILTLCEEDSLTIFGGNGFTSYLWSDGSTDSTLVVDTTGTYWIQVTNEFGCVAIDTIEVTINEYVPMISQMLDSTIICEGLFVTINLEVLQGTEPYSIQWVGLADTLNSITIQADSTAFYVVNITDNCGNTISDSIKVVVIPQPNIDLGDDLLICEGDEITLSAGSGNFFYLWQDGSIDSVYSVTEPGWYWVNVSSVFGCNVTDSVYVDFYPPLDVDLGNDSLFCEAIYILLDPGPDWQSYFWQNGSTEQTLEVSTPGVYWVTVSDLNGCFGTDTISIGNSPAVVVSLGPDTTVCSGDNFNLSPGGNFVTYHWQNGSTDPIIPITQPGLYWVEVTDVNGCMGTDSVQVDLDPSPNLDLGTDTTICFGQSLELEPQGLFSSYQWQDNSTEPYFTVTTSGQYSLTVSNIYNCFSTDEITVEVSTPIVNLGADTIVCAGDTLMLNAGNNYVDYAWQDGSDQQYYPVNDGGTYSVVVVDDAGCTASGAIVVELVPQPIADLSGNEALCEGQTLMLEALAGPFSYFWDGVSGNEFFEVSQAGTYQLQVSNQCGTAEDEITVTEYPTPNINLGPDQLITPGEEIQLDGGEEFDAWLWQDGYQNRIYVVNSENYDFELPYYSVEVSLGPCKSSDTAYIELFDIKIPNVFTPNADQNNDRFQPFVENWHGIHSHHISVFNRWGEKVWESDHFEEGWDGKRNGSYVAEGTYFWILEVKYGLSEASMELKGTVALLDAGK